MIQGTVSGTDMNTEAIRTKYAAALAGLAENCQPVIGYDKPVLYEGGCYQGIWLECGPMEGRIYGKIEPEIAINSHDVFFHHQREDGYLPCHISVKAVGSHSIQMVVPIAATALETAEEFGDEAFLARAYDACSRWDDWLRANRNTQGTGLCELFCQYDSGHDGSPRHAGLPWECPEDDASICNEAETLPYLAPDLSACVYGGRVALAKMAEKLGKSDETAMWVERAEQIRGLILKHLYHPDDECFYDVDAQGQFVRMRGDVLSRVFSEHVVDQDLFERIYARHIKSPDGFWTPYPLPSIAASDPAFVKPIPVNSWGGASQALTALRTPRWFDHYGKTEDHRHLMSQWVEALSRSEHFMQQLDPWTGDFTESGTKTYSPAMLVFVDFVDRLRLLAAGT